MICKHAFANFAWHREQERKNDTVANNLYYLAQRPLIATTVFQLGSHNRNIRSDFEGRLVIIPEEVAPIARNRCRTYGGLGRHWFECQKFELLFEN